MKKTILVLAIGLLGLAGRSFAAAPKTDVPVAVENQFHQQFSQATDVRWEEGKDYFKATFDHWGRTLFAFYADNGDLIGVARNLSSTTLPVRLQTSLKNSYAGYWITDLVGYHNGDGKGFIVTLENPDKVVVLKAAADGGWSVYKTTGKN